MIAIDDYNWLFRPTVYNSYRYANDNGLNSKVPPHHLALGRLLVDFDGHKIRNGYKICASSQNHLYKHIFNPDKIHFGKNYDVELKGLELEEFTNLVEHLYHFNMYHPNKEVYTPPSQIFAEC